MAKIVDFPRLLWIVSPWSLIVYDQFIPALFVNHFNAEFDASFQLANALACNLNQSIIPKYISYYDT